MCSSWASRAVPPFSLLGLTGVMLCLRGVLVADPAARYGADFVPRLPFLFLCILGIAYIITFFIQRYWVEKLQQHVILQARILAVADFTDRHRRWDETDAEIAAALTARAGTEFDPVCVEAMKTLLQ